jgi:hypothetical protein
MNARVSLVIGQFEQLSEDEKKLVLERILRDNQHQAQAVDVIANQILQAPTTSSC